LKTTICLILAFLFFALAFWFFMRALRSIRDKWDFFQLFVNDSSSLWLSVICFILSIAFFWNGI